jgi:hypothetical protein
MTAGKLGAGRVRPGPVVDGADAWEWVRAVQAGDREAFGQLYARYRPPPPPASLPPC